MQRYEQFPEGPRPLHSGLLASQSFAYPEVNSRVIVVTVWFHFLSVDVRVGTFAQLVLVRCRV